MNSADANCFGSNRWDIDFTEADAEQTRIAMRDTVVVTVREAWPCPATQEDD